MLVAAAAAIRKWVIEGNKLVERSVVVPLALQPVRPAGSERGSEARH